MADEKQAYVLCDEGTFLARKGRLGLVALHAGDSALRNGYGAILVRRAPGGETRHAAGKRLLDWLTGPRGREVVRGYVVNGGRPFFLPDSRRRRGTDRGLTPRPCCHQIGLQPGGLRLLGPRAPRDQNARCTKKRQLVSWKDSVSWRIY